ncbi:MAG: YdeI/OmpD-associated family protein [Saprospiraceae bacterium]|nr:YdeI/OmpD-associated family protein [Saprospiraceae bacterium]
MDRIINETAQFYPETKQQWRTWLAENHVEKDFVWLIYYRQKVGKPTITWSEAVDEALCFGWIDSTQKRLDEERSIQFFTKRKPKSTWSKINKDKVVKLIETEQMTQAGLNCIEIAKKNGSWEILDSVESLIIPEDLEKELNAKENAMDFFQSLSKSAKKMMLYWLVSAKRPETSEKRISEIVEQCGLQKILKPL